MKEIPITVSSNSTVDTLVSRSGLSPCGYLLSELSNTSNEMLLRLDRLELVSLIQGAQEVLASKQRKTETKNQSLNFELLSNLNLSSIHSTRDPQRTPCRSIECLKFKVILSVLLNDLALSGKVDIASKVSQVWKA